MAFFKNLFGKKPQPVAPDAALWKSGAEFIGAALLLQFFPEDRPFLTDAELSKLTASINPRLRKTVELWVVFYVTWLLRMLVAAKFGDGFSRDMMAAVYGRIATNEDRAPGIDSIADGLKYWFKEMDDGAQDAFKNPIVIKDQTVPLAYFFALRFLARDGSSPFCNNSNPDFNGLDFEVADALAGAQDITRPRFDYMIEQAAGLPH